MSDKNKFNLKFYSVVKNEDAPPFVGEDLLVCADGLGGAGGHVHTIDYKKHPDMRGELLEAAYGDFDADTRERLDAYLNTLVDPMADETPDTSALWASRIVIGRFVYAMLNGKIPAVNKLVPKVEEPAEAKPCEVADAEAAEITIVASEGDKTSEESAAEPVAEPTAEAASDAEAADITIVVSKGDKTPEEPVAEPVAEAAEEAGEPEAVAEQIPTEITGSTEINANKSGIFGIPRKEKAETIRIDITDPAHREILSDFIHLGLLRVADRFSLAIDSQFGGSLLPTTLTAIRYEEKDDCVVAECLWSGDSRCYVLAEDGLKLLSKDDEDASGAITNLFYIGNKKAVIHYRRYEIKKPCLLMTVSDGFFDPFGDEEYIGVEYTFHKCFLESDSMPSLAARLTDEFDAIHGDDTTVALRAFGFADFGEMKSILTPRAEKIIDLAGSWEKMSAAIQLADLPEEEVRGYITSRTSDKYTSIVPILTQLLIEGEEDIVLSPALRDRVDSKRVELQRRMEEERLWAEKEGLDKAYEELCSNPGNIKSILKPTPPDPTLADAWRELFAQADSIARNSESIAKNKRNLEAVETKYRSFKNRLRSQAEKRRVEMEELMDASKPNQNLERWIKLRREEFFWGAVEYAYTHDIKFSNLPMILRRSCVITIPEDPKIQIKDPFFEEIKKNWQKRETICNEINQVKPSLEEHKRRYVQLVDKLFSWIRGSESFASFFRDDYAKRIGMILPGHSSEEMARRVEEAVKEMFLSQKYEIVNDIVAALAENYGSSSVIDSMYNGTRLARFREYYKYKTSAFSDMLATTREELGKLQTEYYSMLSADGT